MRVRATAAAARAFGPGVALRRPRRLPSLYTVVVVLVVFSALGA